MSAKSSTLKEAVGHTVGAASALGAATGCAVGSAWCFFTAVISEPESRSYNTTYYKERVYNRSEARCPYRHHDCLTDRYWSETTEMCEPLSDLLDGATAGTHRGDEMEACSTVYNRTHTVDVTPYTLKYLSTVGYTLASLVPFFLHRTGAECSALFKCIRRGSESSDGNATTTLLEQLNA